MPQPVLFRLFKLFPLTLLCGVGIWIVCLVPVPETPLEHVRFIDKWVHIGMYFTLTALFWTERHLHGVSLSEWRCMVWGFAAPILMSGLLELLQAYATTYRSGDWLDFAANSAGVMLGAIYGWLLSRKR